MTTIPYTYEVVSVSDRTMTVRYTHPDHGIMDVGVRRPKVGETVALVVAQYSPALFWAEMAADLEPVTAGVTGSGSTQVAPDPVPDPTPEEILAAWRQATACSAFQFRYTLQAWGLMSQVEAIVAQVGEPLTTAFEYAIEVRRMSPSILSVFGMLTMPSGNPPTDIDLDNFWSEAMQVEV